MAKKFEGVEEILDLYDELGDGEQEISRENDLQEHDSNNDAQPLANDEAELENGNEEQPYDIYNTDANDLQTE